MSHGTYGKYFKRKKMLKTCVILNLMKLLVSSFLSLKNLPHEKKNSSLENLLNSIEVFNEYCAIMK